MQQSFKLISKLLIISLLTIFSFTTEPTNAQCSMCRAVAGSGAQNENQKIGHGLNTGILYLLATPYLLGGVAFFIWRKHRKKNQIQPD